MMKYLTPVEYEVMECIDNYIKENGISPTYREICTILKRSSTATIHKHIKDLKTKGYIAMIDGSGRSIRIVSEYSKNEVKYN